MIPIVTTCDEKYLPGLKALYNSFEPHSEGFEFWAMLAGSEDFAQQVRDMGIRVILNPEFPSDVFPTSWRYPDPFPMSYWRLMVPGLFPGAEKSIYIDTDSLILKSLQPLLDIDTGEHPVAATRSISPQSREYGPPGITYGPKHGPSGAMSSLYVFNHEWWFKKDVFGRCLDAMQNEDVEFYTLSQGLLQFVLQDDWHELPFHYQAHAGHKTWLKCNRSEIYTLHFLGTNPWDDYPKGIVPNENKIVARKLWRCFQ